MRIVPQVASVSYSLLPEIPLLAAPRIAGLLPARTASASAAPITVVQKSPSRLERQQAIWAAQDAELEAFLEGARQRLRNVYEKVMQDSADRVRCPYIWEVAS
jgi:hypothetical protein